MKDYPLSSGGLNATKGSFRVEEGDVATDEGQREATLRRQREVASG